MSVSPFYDALDGAQSYVLRYPVRAGDVVGPYWDEQGTPHAGELEDEDILAVSLGGGRYRLAELCSGPFTGCLLRWGDEFEAEADGEMLMLRRVLIPSCFQHYFWITSGGGLENSDLGDVLHEHGGGWEVVAGGMLTVSVPVARLEAFEDAARAIGQDLTSLRLQR